MPHIVRQDIDEDTIMVRIGKQSLQRPELAELVEQSLRLAGRGRPEQWDALYHATAGPEAAANHAAMFLANAKNLRLSSSQFPSLRASTTSGQTLRRNG